MVSTDELPCRRRSSIFYDFRRNVVLRNVLSSENVFSFYLSTCLGIPMDMSNLVYAQRDHRADQIDI